MKTIRFPLFCLGLFVTGANVGAQDTGAAQNLVPAAPFLAAPPEPGHWTITLSRPAPAGPDGQPAAPTPLALSEPNLIDVMMGNGVTLSKLTFQGAPSEETDKAGDYYIERNQDGLRLLGAKGGFPNMFVGKGFLFADWVRSEGMRAFQKVVQYQGATCFYYRNGKPESSTEKDPSYGQEAWIDVKTMLPVAATCDGLEADFHFHAPPDSVSLPADEAQLIKGREIAQRMYNNMR